VVPTQPLQELRLEEPLLARERVVALLAELVRLPALRIERLGLAAQRYEDGELRLAEARITCP
jgi:hypothetical protein